MRWFHQEDSSASIRGFLGRDSSLGKNFYIEGNLFAIFLYADVELNFVALGESLSMALGRAAAT